jgi:hypothetical protein
LYFNGFFSMYYILGKSGEKEHKKRGGKLK